MYNYNAYNEENTIACRNKGDNDQRATGATGGAYNGKAYAPTIENLYKHEDTLLRSVENNGVVRYEILFDDEVYSRFPDLKKATVYFLDFTGLTKAKLNKVKCAA